MSAESKTAHLVKLNPPITKEIFPRKRLFDLIDHKRQEPVIWIEGPAGCGKTTLAANYLETCDFPCLWFDIDSGDSDPATFFYYLGLAVKRIVPQKRKPMPFFTSEYLHGITTFSIRFFEELFNRLPSPSAVVFDNFQDVPQDSRLHDVIRNGLTIIPQGINVFCISREPPPPALIRLRTARTINLIKWNDLRLIPEELDGIARLRKMRYSKETIQRLHSLTDGWVAGVVLILEYVKREGIDEKWVGRMVPEEIADYFGGEIFCKDDAETQEFLIKTSFLTKMTTKMAEDLTGLSNADRILSRLYRNNLFTEKRFQNGFFYQYHPLFRDFLKNRAKEILSENTLQDLRRHAARILEEANETKDAINLLHHAEDWDTLSFLIMAHAPEVLAQGRNEMLKSWLDLLPKTFMENSPWFYFWHGVCGLPFDPSSRQNFFKKAFNLFKKAKDINGCFLSWAGIIDAVVYSMEDFTQLDELIEEINTLIIKFKGLPPGEIEVQVASGMVKALSLRKPQLVDEIESWGEKVLAAEDSPGIMDLKTQTLFHLAHHQVTVGNLEKMSVSVSSLNDLVRSKNASPMSIIVSKHAEAMLYQATCEHDKCIKAVTDGLDLSKSTGIHMMDHMLLGQCISSYQNINDAETAEKYIAQMSLSLDAFKPWDLCHYHQLNCRQAIIRKDSSNASHHGALALKYSNKVGSPLSDGFCHLLCAHSAHSLGQFKKVSEHLSHSFDIADNIQSIPIKFSALMTEAHFNLHRNLNQEKKEAGLKSLRKALEIGKKQELLNIFIDQPAVTAKLCAIALQENIEVEYVQHIIQNRGLVLEDPTLIPGNWPFPVKIYTLGRFGMIINGKPIKFSRKIPQKPLTLLKILIAFGGREVKTETITDALWPDADGDKAEEALKITLRRLRKLLGLPEAIRRHNGYITVDQCYCWWDAYIVERILGQANEKWRKAKREEELNDAALMTMKAIDLYTGPFLSGENNDAWAISYRERLQSKFLRGAVNTGQFLEKSGPLDKAIGFYRRCLEADETEEGFYQRLMVCYHKLGQTTQALSSYERCRETLKSSFGFTPSPETETIRRSLVYEPSPIQPQASYTPTDPSTIITNRF